MGDAELKILQSAFKTYTWSLSVYTILGVLCSLIILCSLKYCGDKCGGVLTKCLILFSFVVFLAIAVVWLLVGGALVEVHNSFDKDFFIKNCERAIKKEYDDMSLNLYVTSVDYRDLFINIVDMDAQLSKTVNSYMCTDFCICPGTPTDQWYKDYEAVPAEEYKKHNRIFAGFDGTIDLTRFNDGKVKPLFWTYVPTTGLPDPNLVKLSSKSMFECIENIDKVGNEFKKI